LAKQLCIDREKFIQVWCTELEELGLIGGRTVSDGAFITNRGMALVEKESPFYSAYKREVKNISIQGPISQSAIAVNGSATVNISSDFLKRFQAAISENPEIDEVKKKNIIQTIKEWSSHPVLLKVLERVLDAY